MFIVCNKGKNSHIFEFNFLSEDLDHSISPIFDDIKIINLNDKQFFIEKVETNTLSTAELATSFYKEDSTKEFEIFFKTPTSFKSNGENIFLPNMHYIFQNLMSRYSEVFEGTPLVEKELLKEVCKNTKIVSYKVQSSYYPIHRVYIPGFIGKIKIRCTGAQTLANYIGMLLRFAEYSGIGVKTTMGMGAVKVRKVYKNG
ncbi:MULTISPECIES: CRISPR-associated endoribonuclease Cas6 [Ligilactobacillus]|nr:CRISPR-associated endoribonuclease Cas6 [Ligilactobacillus animalis]MEE0261222.1 CRISPR-associated endoribonuclease Cas6 [Ligilactobacillus animalis]PNQ52085.1 CRISPR-associated endoribonuclease Cas6 [Ligilactobacillus animalis]